jgi:hypothetical protein
MFEKKELYAFTISLTVSHAFTPNALSTNTTYFSSTENPRAEREIKRRFPFQIRRKLAQPGKQGSRSSQSTFQAHRQEAFLYGVDFLLQ